MKNEQTPPPDRFQPKLMTIWMLIIGMILGLLFLNTPQTVQVKKWSMTRVLESAQNGNIIEASIKHEASGGPSWYVIEGKALLSQAEGQGASAQSVQEQSAAASRGITSNTVRFRAEGRLSESRFDQMTSAFNFREKPSSTLMMDILLNLIPFLIIILGIYFLFARQIKMAGKGAMSFGKSKAKLLVRDNERVTFKDVAGCEEAKEEVAEIVDFLRDPKKFQRIGGKIPKGILMVGPPGTGKTLLARAIACEANVPFFTTNGSEFVEMFVGVGAARMRDLFEQARKNAPCLVFIDELDSVGRQRGAGLGGGNDEREQTLNSMLVEMDGFDGREGVIIIAATNRPDVLDSALTRPGRFDRQVNISLPDLNGREEILKVHAKNYALSKEVDLNLFARRTPGFAGADLQNLLNEGALTAARYNKTEITDKELDTALEKIAFGREHRRLMDEDDKKVTAYHEAGHAVVAACINDPHLPVHKVTIIPRGQSLGSTMFVPKKDILNHSQQSILNQICWSMGGRIAEELVIGDITSGASGDIKMATKMARHMVCDWGMSPLGLVAYGENQDHIFLGKEIARNQTYSEQTAREIDEQIQRIVNEGYVRAKDILESHRSVLDGVAQALLEYETIDGKHVHEILEHGKIISPIESAAVKPGQGDSGNKDDKSKEKDKDKVFDQSVAPSGAPA